MTPLFDATITNLKLATHGRLEAMNAVLISSIAASTFNAQLEAWEPLVEPFEGIFKYCSTISFIIKELCAIYVPYKHILFLLSGSKHMIQI